MHYWEKSVPKEFLTILTFCLFAFGMVSCGGGGGGGSDDVDSTNGPTTELRGTAATGLALIGTVYITDSSGTQINVTTDSNGGYVADITGMTAPFIISAVPNNGSLPTQYAYASGPGIINITPLTTLALFIASGQSNLRSLESNWATRFGNINPDDLTTAQAQINANFAPEFADQSIDPATYDFFSAPLMVGEGFDLVLDRLDVEINLTAGTFSIILDGSPQDFNLAIDISGINIGNSGPVTSDAVVFDDDYGPNVSFQGADDDFSIDTSVRLLGNASLRVEVPATGLTGGFFFVSQGRDLSGYNALSFWARSDQNLNDTLEHVSIGQSPLSTELYGAVIENGVILTTEWQQFIIPIPNPSVLTALDGLFYIAERSDTGTAYTMWLDDIRYVSLNPGIVANPRPSIRTAVEDLFIGDSFYVGVGSVVYNINGDDVTLSLTPESRYFDYTSFDEAVATVVDGRGLVEAVGLGSTDVTASLAGVAASGTITVNVNDRAVVFDDSFDLASFGPIEGAVNDVSIDNVSITVTGNTSFQIEVPATGFTGGFFTDNSGRDLSAYNVLTFWARASANANIEGLGFFLGAEVSGINVNLTSEFQKFIIPIPDPSLLTNVEKLFYFIEESQVGAYTIWIDDIRYENLDPGLITDPRPSISTQFENRPIGTSFIFDQLALTYNVDGSDVTLSPVGASFFDFTSSNTDAAIIDTTGRVQVVGSGIADITASVNGVPATGIATVLAPGETVNPIVFGDDYGIDIDFVSFEGATNDINIDAGNPAQSGSASLRVEVPSSGYTGGTLVVNTPREATGFNAVTFWARASVSGKTLDVAGFGDDGSDRTFSAEISGGVSLSTTWTKYVIYIPNPLVLQATTGLFHFAEGGSEGAYTIWFDNISYERLDLYFTNVRPTINTATRYMEIAEVLEVADASLIVNANGVDLTLDPVSSSYFDFSSSNDNVAAPIGLGRIEGRGLGSADIIASLNGGSAVGMLTVNINNANVDPALGSNQFLNGNFETFSVNSGGPFDPPDAWNSFGAIFTPGFAEWGYSAYGTQANGANIFPSTDPFPGFMTSRALKTFGISEDAGGGRVQASLGTIYQEFTGAAIPPAGTQLRLTGWAYHSSHDLLGAGAQAYLVIKCLDGSFANLCPGAQSTSITMSSTVDTWIPFSVNLASLPVGTAFLQAGVEFKQCDGDGGTFCDIADGAGSVFFDELVFSNSGL
jgi:hypothetical protein